MQNHKYTVIFFGTSEFAMPTLEQLVADARFNVALVVTMPDRPVGRSQNPAAAPIKTVAEKLGLSVAQYDKFSLKDRSSCVRKLSALNSDIAIVAAYGRIIPEEIINLPQHGTLNVHPSLLPKYRGPSPIQAAVANGDTETGVTIMKVDAEMDHGPILAQRIVPVGSSDSTPTLTKKLADVGAKLLVETIIPYLEGFLRPVEQDHARATYTKLLERDDGRISIHDLPDAIERKFRSYDPWPGIWTIASTPTREFRVKLIEVGVESGALVIRRVQPEGKRSMSYDEFLRGHHGVTLG